MSNRIYDVAFLGHYTKDTIVTPEDIRVADGGAFFYGANVAARMGLKTAAITKLAEKDFGVVRNLERMEVDVVALPSAKSTCLRLEYPVEEALINREY